MKKTGFYINNVNVNYNVLATSPKTKFDNFLWQLWVLF